MCTKFIFYYFFHKKWTSIPTLFGNKFIECFLQIIPLDGSLHHNVFLHSSQLYILTYPKNVNTFKSIGLYMVQIMNKNVIFFQYRLDFFIN